MSLDEQRNILKEEYELEEKDYEAYFQPKFSINENIKQDVIKKYNVYVKKLSKIRVSGGKDKDTRIQAIIDLLQLNKKQEEEDFYDEDSDNIDLIRNFGQGPSDAKQTAAKNQPQQTIPQSPPSSVSTDDKKLEESTSSENPNSKQNRPRRNQSRNYQQDRNNPQNRNYQKNQPRRTNSTPNENNSGHRPNRNLSSDAPPSDHKRGGTSNYIRNQNRRDSNNDNQNRRYPNNDNKNRRIPNNDNQDGNEKIDDNNIDRQDENLKNEEENNTRQINRPRNERARGGRGRGGRGGRGRGGRGGRGRGGRGGRRAPLGPRASILDGESEQKEQNNNEDSQNVDNQRPPQGRRHYNNNRSRGGNRGGNRTGGRGGNRGRNNNYRQNQQPLPPEIENPQTNQQPILPEDISYKEETAPTIQITPEIKHILMLMDNQITTETTEQEILDVPWFHLEKLVNPLNDENPQPGTLMNAPYLLVEFLIESFATDQPESYQHIEHKPLENKQLMHLSMPFSIPLTFQIEGDKIQVGFFSLPDFSSEDMNELCSTVLTTLSQRDMLVISINEVDKTFSFTYLEQLSQELDFVYLRSVPQENAEMETISFTIKIMIYNWSPEKEQAILGRIGEMFKDSSMYECSKCGCTYSPLDGSKCFLTRHKGRQIPFPDSGEMELVEYDEESGQAIVYVYYECCGEVEQDEPGCETTTTENGSHEPFGESSSTMSVEKLSIYSDS